MTKSMASAAAKRDHGSGMPTRAAEYLERYARDPGAPLAGQENQPTSLAPVLQRMQLHDAPFRFATVDSFLPQDLYAAVLASWQPEAAFTTVSFSGVPSGYFGSRKQQVVENSATGIARDDPPVWAAVRHALRHADFVRCLFSAFSDIIEANLTSLGPQAQDAPCFKLYANIDAGPTEALGAHIDALTKLLTIVIYMDLSGAVTSDSPGRWGTSLYGDDQSATQPLQFTPNAGLPVAKQVEFAPNRAFIMPNKAGALHGVGGGEAGVTRRTLMCGYYLQQPQ